MHLGYGIEKTLEILKLKYKKIDGIICTENLTKSEKKVFPLIAEATVLSDYGVSNTEIQKVTGLSKRTVINAVNKFKKNGLIVDTKIGNYTFHRFM